MNQMLTPTDATKGAPVSGDIDTNSEDYRRHCLALYVLKLPADRRERFLDRMAPSLRTDIRNRMLREYASRLIGLLPEIREQRLAKLRHQGKFSDRHRRFAQAVEAQVRELLMERGGDHGVRA